MAQQTAVEWLENELHNFIHPEHGKDFLPILEKAKKMEKQQIIRTCLHTSGRFFDTKSWIDILNNEIKKAEQYYNETYNK